MNNFGINNTNVNTNANTNSKSSNLKIFIPSPDTPILSIPEEDSTHILQSIPKKPAYNFVIQKNEILEKKVKFLEEKLKEADEKYVSYNYSLEYALLIKKQLLSINATILNKYKIFVIGTLNYDEIAKFPPLFEFVDLIVKDGDISLLLKKILVYFRTNNVIKYISVKTRDAIAQLIQIEMINNHSITDNAFFHICIQKLYNIIRIDHNNH
jgi:hypothetical protein